MNCNKISLTDETADEWSENFMKQSVDKYRKISFCNLWVTCETEGSG